MSCGLFNLHQREYNHTFDYFNITSFIDNHTLDSTVNNRHGLSVMWRWRSLCEHTFQNLVRLCLCDSFIVLIIKPRFQCRAERWVTYCPFWIPYHWYMTVKKNSLITEFTCHIKLSHAKKGPGAIGQVYIDGWSTYSGKPYIHRHNLTLLCFLKPCLT